MDSSTVILLGAATTLVGALAGAAGALITGRATARKVTTEGKAIEAKLPAEVDSVVVQGAEQAVLTMAKALQAANGRIDELEHERAQDRKRLAELEGKVRTLEGKVAAAETATAEARKAGDDLRGELNSLIRDQRNRK